MITFEYVEKLFILFLFYSFGGWLIEVVGELIKSKKFINRGFLIGPICPVYGVGAILITLTLSQYQDDILIIFGIASIVCGLLEYFTSFIMEKVFNARWWDYSNFKFNINGRVCLEVISLFGFAGIGIIKILNPIFMGLIIDKIPQNIIDTMVPIMFTVLIIDIIISFSVVSKIKKISKEVSKEFKDNTEEISKKVRETIISKSLIYRRIIFAFPQVFADRIKMSKDKIVEVAGEIKTNVKETRDKTFEKVLDIKEKASSNIKTVKSNFTQIGNDVMRKERISKILNSLQDFKLVTINKKDTKDTKNEK